MDDRYILARLDGLAEGMEGIKLTCTVGVVREVQEFIRTQSAEGGRVNELLARGTKVINGLDAKNELHVNAWHELYEWLNADSSLSDDDTEHMLWVVNQYSPIDLDGDAASGNQKAAYEDGFDDGLLAGKELATADSKQPHPWTHILYRHPDPGMVVVFDTQCKVTQAYWSGLSFHEPWGDEYPGSKQPNWWMPMPPSPPTGADSNQEQPRTMCNKHGWWDIGPCEYCIKELDTADSGRECGAERRAVRDTKTMKIIDDCKHGDTDESGHGQ